MRARDVNGSQIGRVDQTIEKPQDLGRADHKDLAGHQDWAALHAVPVTEFLGTRRRREVAYNVREAPGSVIVTAESAVFRCPALDLRPTVVDRRDSHHSADK